MLGMSITDIFELGRVYTDKTEKSCFKNENVLEYEGESSTVNENDIYKHIDEFSVFFFVLHNLSLVMKYLKVCFNINQLSPFP